MASLADKFAYLRAKRGWTLKQLSERTRISISHLNALEKGTRQSPSFQLVVQLSNAFEVPVDYFRDDVDVADGMALSRQIARLYDEPTTQFIASEQARPYVTFAMRLAERSRQNPALDAPDILQEIAEFIRDRKTSYESD